MKARVLAVWSLAFVVSKQGMDQAGYWARSFRVARTFKKPNQEQKSRVVHSFKGHARLPRADEGAALLAAWDSGSPTEKEALAAKVLEVVEGVPEAAEAPGKAIEVQLLLTSTLCCLGGTRFAGRAPRGGMAYKLNKHLQGPGVDA